LAGNHVRTFKPSIAGLLLEPGIVIKYPLPSAKPAAMRAGNTT